MPRRAAALIIGNELLSGKVSDANLPVLARTLFELGIRLERAVMCRDEEVAIASELRLLCDRYDLVFTSGGIGPTHDDRTIQGVARAFGVALRRDPGLEARILAHYGPRTTEGHLRMAEIPEGSRLIESEELAWPVLQVGNVYVLPGVPEFFARKLKAIRHLIGMERPYLSAAVETRCDEGEIAALLERIEREHGVEVGSYPRFVDGKMQLRLTLDSQDPEQVEKALEALLRGLNPAMVLGVERPKALDQKKAKT
ncbi:MAG: competence/damage-inducible protein A [Sandaracinaceae bacterium]|nr:competence/damage-inducible protein A [Sandaracinaceae bacterium]MDW8247597.1 competence/damage-inducible protein A [Sandaracinaceae bacterium]